MKVKTIMISIILLGLMSCTKDWKCCIDTTTTHTDPMLIPLNGTTTHCIDFRGDKDEKEAFEENGTNSNTYSNFGNSGTYTIDQKTECVKD